jgi:hypothetical protein
LLFFLSPVNTFLLLELLWVFSFFLVTVIAIKISFRFC